LSGRIRTVKPEWLEDELLAAASDEARVLSVGLILLADDYGNGRASIATIAAEVWRYALERDDGANAPEVLAKASRAFRELLAIGFIGTWTEAGQRYFTIRNWARHQRVDKPGKPLVPKPRPDFWAHVYDGKTEDSGKPREVVATVSGGIPESLRPDLRPVPTTNDQEGKGPGPSAPAHEPPVGLRAKAQSWISDATIAALVHPQPEAWPETQAVVLALTETFGGPEQAPRNSGDRRMQVLLARWAEGRTTEELVAAIRGAARDDLIQRKPQLQNLTTILRDSGEVDRYARLLTIAPIVQARPANGNRAGDLLGAQLARAEALQELESGVTVAALAAATQRKALQ
jgi:hypothetical protein